MAGGIYNDAFTRPFYRIFLTWLLNTKILLQKHRNSTETVSKRNIKGWKRQTLRRTATLASIYSNIQRARESSLAVPGKQRWSRQMWNRKKLVIFRGEWWGICTCQGSLWDQHRYDTASVSVHWHCAGRACTTPLENTLCSIQMTRLLRWRVLNIKKSPLAYSLWHRIC